MTREECESKCEDDDKCKGYSFLDENVCKHWFVDIDGPPPMIPLSKKADLKESVI